MKRPGPGVREALLTGLALLTSSGIVAYGLSYWLLSRHQVQAQNLQFERPWAGVLLLALPVVLLAQTGRRKAAAPRLQVSQGALFQELAGSQLRSPRVLLRHFLPAFRAVSLGLFALALMGPQSVHARQLNQLRGIDIVLTLDMSLSMEANDILPSRFEGSKAVVDQFIRQRPNDRIGAVVFAEEAYTLMPLTTDKTVLRNTVDGLQLKAISGQGTAIGDAIATSLNRLRSSDAKSRIVILLTDGDSNSGSLSPQQAADFAQALGVRIYTVLMGQSEDAPVTKSLDVFRNPVVSMGHFPVNPELLRTMAEQTGGEFFSVVDRRGLEESFHRILDALERSQIEEQGLIKAELFFVLLAPALGLLILEMLLAFVLVRRWP